MKLSLANRISLVVVSLVTVFGVLAGYALYDKVRRSLKDEMEGRQNVRLAWIESCLEYDDDHLEMEPRTIPSNAAELWQVATRDGRVLWKSPENPKFSKVERFSSETRRFDLGPKDLPVEQYVARPSDLRAEERPDGKVIYHLPERNLRVSLLITAKTPSDALYGELARLRLALFTVIPIGVLLMAILLTWFVRRQHRPLEIVALQSSLIGPTDVAARIEVEANSTEIELLRNSINGLIARMAEGLERERRFSSYAAHELRTPLAQLRTNIEVTLRRDRSPDEYKRYLGEALQDVHRLQKLVLDLLNLTRAQEAVVEEHDCVSVDTIIAQAVRASGGSVEVPARSDAFIKGNEELLIAAVRNVLDNAVRYAPDTRSVIGVDVTKDLVKVKITDCGPGIPESERERIFQPLTRLDTARSITTRSDGFGLGLAVARAAVRAGGGELLCKSREDGKNGACFIFELKRTMKTSSTTEM